MRLLTNILQQFLNGQGSVISVVGEAGLGKSRLIAELQSSCAQVTENSLWASGRALSHADNASYLRARDLLRNLLGSSAGMSPAELGQHLHAQLKASLPGQSAELYPYLAHLFDLPLNDDDKQRITYLSGAMLHERNLQAVQQFIIGQAAQTPLALIWEDLHWADPSSLELLETILPLAQQHPLLLVLVYRRPIKGSKIWHFRQRVSQSDNNAMHHTINLPPLTQADSHRLLQNLLGDDALPENIRQAIVDKAEGNPFYLEEVIRSMIHSGALTRTNGRWTASTRLDQITLPDSLQGVIMARIDQLDPQTKRVLQVASVIGRKFSAEVLASVLQQQ
jgi:predicted ATPase